MEAAARVSVERNELRVRVQYWQQDMSDEEARRRLREGKVMKRGDDLIMAIRMEGSFVEVITLDPGP